VVIVWILAKGAALAQDSAPAPAIEQLKPVMMELQSGTWSLEKAKPMIETLVKADHRAAASWWVTLADDAVKAKKLPASASNFLAAQRKACESEGANDEDRKVSARLARHLEAVVISKNFQEARAIASVARLAALLAPDANTSKTLDGLEKKIGPTQNQDPSNLPRQQKQFDEMRPAILSMVDARLERELAEYEAAGCKPGRLGLRAALKQGTKLLGEERVRSLTKRLDKAAHAIEPTRTLSLCARPDDDTHVFRNGEEERVSLEEPRDFKVLDGDLLQFVVPRSSTFAPDGKTALYCAAFSARLDGTDLAAKHWFLNTAADPTLIDPPLGPTSCVRAAPTDPRLKNFGPQYQKDGAFLTIDSKGPAAVALTPPQLKYEAEFAERKLNVRWVGATTDKCVVVLKIPEN
jgi:hypothetical protein